MQVFIRYNVQNFGEFTERLTSGPLLKTEADTVAYLSNGICFKTERCMVRIMQDLEYYGFFEDLFQSITFENYV